MRRLTRYAVFALIATSLAMPAAAQPGGRSEYRSLNTEFYQINIQKKGKVDVILGGVLPVVSNAYPMVWFADEREPDELDIDGRMTQRYRVEDRLGLGHGMMFRYKNCEWTLRTYPTQPFITVQVAYVNDTKKPVRVRALMPWTIGDPERGALMLGPGTVDSAILVDALSSRPHLARGDAHSADMLAILNPRNGQSLVAGFLTQERAQTTFEAGEPEADDEQPAFGKFRAVCTFDPPVTVEPGEQLTSEVLYLAWGETDPVVGIERYARAVAVANNRPRAPALPRHHRWVVDINGASQDALDNQLETVAQLAQHWDIDRAIVKPEGLSEVPDAVLRNVADLLREAGYEVVLWRDTPPDAANTQNAITAYAQGLLKAAVPPFLVTDLGQFVLEPQGDAMTRMERQRAGVNALRDVLSPEALLYTTTSSLNTILLANGVIAQATWIPEEWKRPPLRSGVFVVDTVQRFHVISQLARTSVLVDASEDGRETLVRQLTAASLLGAELLLEGLDEPGSVDALAVLERALPVAPRAARPVDLFYNERPRVLHLPTENAAGEAHVVAVFNWSAVRSEITTVPLPNLGLAPGAFYTVYDFWNDQYLGTAADRVDVTVAPNSVTVLILRPHRNRPVLLRTGTNLAQSVPGIETADWDARKSAFRLTVSGEPGEEIVFPFRLPGDFRFISAEGENGEVSASFENNVLRLRVQIDDNGEAAFRAQFERAAQ